MPGVLSLLKMCDMNKGWLWVLAVPLSMLAACQRSPGAGGRSPQGTASMQADSLMQHYLQIASALSTDSAIAADAAAGRMEGSLTLLNAAGSDSLQVVLGNLSRELAAFVGAADLKGKRFVFEQITTTCQKLLGRVKLSRGILYRAYCPMYGSQGAYWFTAADTIRNPYMGSAMPGCGEIQDTLTF